MATTVRKMPNFYTKRKEALIFKAENSSACLLQNIRINQSVCPLVLQQTYG